MEIATLLSILGAVGSVVGLVASVGFMVRKSRAERHLVARLREDPERLQKKYKAITDRYGDYLVARGTEQAQLRETIEELEREFIIKALAKLDSSDRQIVAQAVDQSSSAGRLLYGKKLLDQALRNTE